jgi:hypothetical protein
MDRDENTHRNLISLFKVFKNRPYHLSKYLLDNDAFNEQFLNKIKNSDKLSDLSETNLPKFFQNLNQMEEFYNSLLESKIVSTTRRSKKELTIELNEQLSKLIQEEKYEEAAALRDYMMLHGVKKK